MVPAIAFVCVLVVFSIIDTLWLSWMAGRVYRPLIGDLLAEKFRIGPAIAFYGLYAAGLTIFAVMPGLREAEWKSAVIWGALFGLFAYGTYDLTNYATLKTWGLKITLVDMAWGVFVSGAASGLACFAAMKLTRLLNVAP